MSYKVETTAEEHELVLRETIIDWTKQDYDVHLVSKEGHISLTMSYLFIDCLPCHSCKLKQF